MFRYREWNHYGPQPSMRPCNIALLVGGHWLEGFQKTKKRKHTRIITSVLCIYLLNLKGLRTHHPPFFVPSPEGTHKIMAAGYLVIVGLGFTALLALLMKTTASVL